MSDAADPPRWREAGSGAPAGLGALFDAGARDAADERELAKLASRLAPLLDAPAAPPAGQAPHAASKALWVGGALGGAVAVLIAGLALRDARHVPPASPSGASAGAPSQSAPSGTPRLDHDVTAAPPAAVPSAEVPSAAPAAEPSALPSASPAPRPTPAARSATPKAAASEAELLERARRALETNPSLALSLARQHEQRFPNGVLKQEREVIAIEALRRLGRANEAASRAGGFTDRYPDSAHRRAVETGTER